MLHILFLVLIIIGIILILLLCSILFIPVRYYLEAETTGGIEQLSVHARAHWLFHLIFAYVDYQEKETDWQVRIGWNYLNRKKEDNKEEKTEETVSVTPNQGSENKDVTEDEFSEHVVSKGDTTVKAKKKGKKQNWFQKIKCTILDICGKIKLFLETKDKLISFITDEEHITALRRIKQELVVIAKHVRPRTIKGHVRFGLEDPYHTGQILAVLSVLYPFYGDHIQIYPDFGQKILEGKVQMKGRITVSRFLMIVFRLYFDKNIRQTYKHYKLLKL